MGKNTLEWKIRSLVPDLVRKQNVAKGEGFETKLMFPKYGRQRN